MAHQNDDAVEKVLAALNKATPPEGMEARIAQHLQQQAATRSVSPAAIWWRGAITGAAAAALAIGILLLTQHRIPTQPTLQQGPNLPAAQAPARTIPAMPVSVPTAHPCSSPAILPEHKSATPVRLGVAARDEEVQPSRPAPSQPLTAEERGLVRLAHIAGPKQLATLNPEVQAKLEAQEEADFTKFFTPPPRPKPVEENE